MENARYRQNCLRCETVKLRVIPTSTQEITFYECPSCSRHFAQKLGQGLCDRWLSPIGLVLYGIVFERYPQDAFQRIAEQFLEQRADDIPSLIEEITQELQKPTQNVCDILDLQQNEQDVRAFLQLVVDYWKKNKE
jgi:transposase-like protein